MEALGPDPCFDDVEALSPDPCFEDPWLEELETLRDEPEMSRVGFRDAFGGRALGALSSAGGGDELRRSPNLPQPSTTSSQGSVSRETPSMMWLRGSFVFIVYSTVFRPYLTSLLAASIIRSISAAGIALTEAMYCIVSFPHVCDEKAAYPTVSEPLALIWGTKSTVVEFFSWALRTASTVMSPSTQSVSARSAYVFESQ